MEFIIITIYLIVIAFAVIAGLGFIETKGLLSRLTYLLFLIAGFVIGVFTFLVFAVLCAQLTNPPGLMEDRGPFIFYLIAPIGGVLGYVTASVLTLTLRRYFRTARAVCITGSLPVVYFCVDLLFKTAVIYSKHPSNSARDYVFILLVFGFPLLWLGGLWMWSFKRAKTAS